MRPVKLVIFGFGPYAEKTVLNLDRLGEQGLYLITGETGAGKTTIFDAIAFALFGEPSGGTRENSMLRSKFAGPGTPTDVELTFLYAGKTYVIRRNPEYERPAKRGGGMTKEMPSASLTMPDGKIINRRIADVDAAVHDILGLDRAQFRQIAMIAQGEFQKLILADTKERQDIFRDIFRTNLYQDFQNRVKKEVSDIKSRLGESQRAMEQYASGIRLPENSDELPPTPEDKIAALGKILQEDTARQESAESELETVDKMLSELVSAETKALQDEKNRRDLETAKAAVAEAEKKKEILDAAAVREKEREPEMEELGRALNAIEAELKKYADITKKDREISDAARESDSAAKKEAESEQQSSILRCRLERERAEYRTLENAESELQKLLGEREKLLSRQTDILDYECTVKNAAEKGREAKKRLEEYAAARNTANVLQNKAQSLRRRFNDEQAGILARELCDNEPCPVCGSRTHPHPAVCGEEAPSEQAVKEAERTALDAQQAVNTASELSGKAKGEAESAEKTAEEKKRKLFGEIEIDISDEIGSIQRAVLAVERNTKEAEAKVNRRRMLSEAIAKREKTLTDTEKTLTDAKAQHAAIRAKLESLRAQSAAMRAECVYASAADAEKEQRRIEGLRREIRSAQEKTARELQIAENILAKEKGRAAQLEELLKGCEPQDPAALSEKKKIYTQKKDALRGEIKAVGIQLDANRTAKEGLENSLETFHSLSMRYAWMNTLSNTVSGSLSGKDRIMLETYVQVTYFERILGRANVHFLRMSGNKYELKRSEDTSDHKSVSGLEIDVIDHYNGSVRSVKSLSGGEKFLASLSLALGLSEEIQASAGGVHMDSLFVDEGFGSLDEESLRLAMRALHELSEGNRLIGIISHVADLRREIDRQIVVRRNPDGTSCAEIITE